MVSRAQPGNELVAGGGGAEVHEAVAHVAPVKEPENLYVYVIYIYIRRKFRSQTSDNMDRWKAE